MIRKMWQNIIARFKSVDPVEPASECIASVAEDEEVLHCSEEFLTTLYAYQEKMKNFERGSEEGLNVEIIHVGCDFAVINNGNFNESIIEAERRKSDWRMKRFRVRAFAKAHGVKKVERLPISGVYRIHRDDESWVCALKREDVINAIKLVGENRKNESS